jgi:putative PIN family toxin of toxin-antitoxin system
MKKSVKVVLDTNVLISGIFFSGPPFEILKAWRDRRISIVVSAEILEEYQRVGERLANKFPGIDLEPFLALLTVEAEIVLVSTLATQVCEDPDDDKFIACALSGKCKVIVSGDKHLRKVSGYKGIEVVSPRKFIESYLIV